MLEIIHGKKEEGGISLSNSFLTPVSVGQCSPYSELIPPCFQVEWTGTFNDHMRCQVSHSSVWCIIQVQSGGSHKFWAYRWWNWMRGDGLGIPKARAQSALRGGISGPRGRQDWQKLIHSLILIKLLGNQLLQLSWTEYQKSRPLRKNHLL